MFGLQSRNTNRITSLYVKEDPKRKRNHAGEPKKCHKNWESSEKMLKIKQKLQEYLQKCWKEEEKCSEKGETDTRIAWAWVARGPCDLRNPCLQYFY